MNTKLMLLICTTVVCSQANAKSNGVPTRTVNGNIDNRHSITALTNATIHVNATKTIKNATLVIQDQRIIDVGKNVEIPDSAIQINYTGKHVYPGFIHLDSSVGLPDLPPKKPFQWGGPETITTTVNGAYNSNEAIKASYQAATNYTTNNKTNETLRAAGFTNALSLRKDGIMRGTSVFSHLADDAEASNIIKSNAAQHYSFDKGSSSQDYPISLMGSVALIRQTWLDAQWYKQQNQMLDLDLAAINSFSKLPKIISSSNWQQNLLAAKIGQEFNTEFVVKTGGDSYQNIKAVAGTEQTLIVPLETPETPAVSDPLDALNVSYKDLKAWEVAPYNPAILEKNNIEFALLPDSSPKGVSGFLASLRKAHNHGLSEATAIKAMTTVPAKILGLSDELGSITQGKWANFIVTDAPLMQKDAQLTESWVAGQVHTIKALPQFIGGKYELTDNTDTYLFSVKQQGGKLKLTGTDDEDNNKYSITENGKFFTLTITSENNNDGKENVEKDAAKENHSYYGVINDQQITALNGGDWQLKRIDDLTVKANKDETPAKDIPSIPQPFSAYGLASIETNDSVLIKNATVWTNEDSGIMDATDVLVVNGTIKKLGNNLSTPKDTKEVDGTGMHLTSGIIDEHAHIALLSVNDVAVNSSMVRMQDAINPHDVNLYRNLAGGVTTAQLLHGSANPIGGQSALIKLKWGVEKPQDLLINGADGYIKFALGENVKRSRNAQSVRYPLTRMGVEQVYRDAFTQAKAYEKSWQDYNNLSNSAKKKTTAPRRDLAMDATLEVLNQERFVSCHSYVQSEINMLMHVADDFNFNINTFTHILEGYKVADKMQQHGVGASTFADWWAYKYEVNYAIPYNAALMHNAGVVTAINSDSAEMSRRLNQEAAKSVKYGGLSEQEAWKLVTLNPAKLLHLEDRMGSIAVGKDADLVLWSDNPLSIYAKAEKTMVDGVIYYDRSKQQEIEQTIADERSRLIDMAKNTDGKKSKFKSQPPKTFECESITGHSHIDHQLFFGAVQ